MSFEDPTSKDSDDFNLIRGEGELLRDEKKERDPFFEKFVIEITPEIIDKLKDLPEEKANQEIMFEIRKVLLEREGGRKYSWVPQAIEACMRSLSFRDIRFLEINPENERLKIITGEEVIDENIDDFSDYSLELLLEEVEDKEAFFDYSPEMKSAIDNLSPSARFRWDLIIKAAYCQFLGNNRAKKGTFSVKKVVRDLSNLSPEGIGVFSDRVRGFSLVKLTGKDVPLTPREKDILAQADKIYQIKETDPLLKEFCRLINGLRIDIDDFINQGSATGRLFNKLREAFAKDKTNRIVGEISDLMNEFLEHQLKCLKLKDEIKNFFYNAKARYKEEKPFEVDELPKELKEKISRALDYYLELIMKISQILVENREVLISISQEIFKKAKEKSPDICRGDSSKTVEGLRRFSLEGLEGVGGKIKRIAEDNS